MVKVFISVVAEFWLTGLLNMVLISDQLQVTLTRSQPNIFFKLKNKCKWLLRQSQKKVICITYFVLFRFKRKCRLPKSGGASVPFQLSCFAGPYKSQSQMFDEVLNISLLMVLKINTAKNTVFLLISWCGNFVEKHSFHTIFSH